MIRWTQRLVDYVASAVLGTFVLWFAAWQMPTLTGNRPQELFVSIQDHLPQVKATAFVAIVAARGRSGDGRRAIHVAPTAAVAEPSRDRPWPWAVVFWAVSGAFAFMVLWEYLGFGWMTWVVLALVPRRTRRGAGWVGSSRGTSCRGSATRSTSCGS